MPIGNPRDITLRAVDVLGAVQIVACEDTRTAKEALAALGIRPPRLISYFEHNEQDRTHQLVELLKAGNDVALISEAGTPGISDPGYRLVSACVANDIKVVPIPGANAAVTAMCASGLPPDRFLFVGFPPKKGARFQRFLASWMLPGVTTMFYLPARRMDEFALAMTTIAPTATVVVARELTKTYEEFVRGTPAEIRDHYAANPPRGECTILVRPAEQDEAENEPGAPIR
jgi:16S rRNA (cytidine1402-2'-O)-methyltransferase